MLDEPILYTILIKTVFFIFQNAIPMDMAIFANIVEFINDVPKRLILVQLNVLS